VGKVGDTVSILSLVALPIIVIVWRILPETRGIGLIGSGPSWKMACFGVLPQNLCGR
jgi:hypothetical protein